MYFALMFRHRIIVPALPFNNSKKKKEKRYHNTVIISRINQSHLVKHTDIFSMRRPVMWLLVVVELTSSAAATHPAKWLAHASRSAWTHVPRGWHPCRPRWAGHVRIVCCCLNSFASVDLGHSSNPSASQSRILIAISPTVHSSLNQSSLSAQTGIQFRQCPSNRVAFRLINQSVASVLILAATGSRIYAVLRLEFRRQCVNIHRLDIASNRIFHLDAITRIFESNPLNSIVVLSHNQRSRCWDWARCRIGVDTSSATRNIVLIEGRSIGLMLWRS